MSDKRDEQIDLSGVVNAAKARFGVIAVVAFLTFLGTEGYTWIQKPLYEARTALLIPTDAPDKSALSLLQEKSQAGDVLKGVLMSHRIQAELAKPIDMNLREFNKFYRVDSDTVSSELSITFRDTDKSKALGVVTEAVRLLGGVSKDLGFSRAKQQADEYQRAFDKAQKDLLAAEDNLVQFQQSSKISIGPDPLTAGGPYVSEFKKLKQKLTETDAQINGLKAAAGSKLEPEIKVPSGSQRFQYLRQKLTEAELDLRLKLQTYQEDTDEVRSARQSVAETKQELEKEIGRFNATVSNGAGDELVTLLTSRMVLRYELDEAERVASVAPKEAQQFYELLNKVTMLSRQTQDIGAAMANARLQASVDRVRYSVLDEPYVADRPVNKEYLIMGLASLVGGTILGMIVAMILHARKHVR